MHTHSTILLIEWTEIKILLPRATAGLWNRNCNKFVQKLNHPRTGQQTHWHGGNRGVSIKNQSYAWMQLSYDKVILGTGEKVEKNPHFTARLWTAANGTTSSIVNRELLCLWHFQRVSDSKDTSGMAQAGGALGSGAALGPAAEAQRPQASDHALRRSKWGEKKSWGERTGKIFCSPSERS